MKTDMRSLRVLAATIAVAPFFVGAAAMKPMWQTPYGLNKKGNALYEKGDFEGALERYDEALVLLSEAPSLHYNRGNAFFRDQKIEEALEAYAHAFEESDPEDAEAKPTRQAAAYNAGNTLYESEKYSEALEAYREALRLAPGDLDAKRNYELALQQMQSCENPEGEEGEEGEENEIPGRRAAGGGFRRDDGGGSAAPSRSPAAARARGARRARGKEARPHADAGPRLVAAPTAPNAPRSSPSGEFFYLAGPEAEGRNAPWLGRMTWV
jgi:tetratricopeptide (TPR) repeat protein